MDLKRSVWISIALLIPFAGILFFNASHYFPFISDDTLISLRYADRLLDGYGLTWTDGHPVEGYSNLLWVLLIALLGVFGVDLIDASRVLGFVSMMTIMYALLYYYLQKHQLRTTWFPITIALLFLSLSAPIAVWSIGGLEQPLYGALIALSILFMHIIIDVKEDTRRYIIYLSLVLGLLSITRPDGPIFTIACAMTLVILAKFSGRERLLFSSLIVLLIPLLFYLGQLLFRLYYYGEWVPNTALVKISPSYHHFINGLHYLKDGLLALAPFSVIAIIAMVAMILIPHYRAKSIYLLIITLTWSAYIVFIGGDIFPAYRHFIPLIVVFAFALAEGLYILSNYLQKRPSLRYFHLLVVLFLLLFIPFTYLQFTNAENHRAVEERWEWDCKDLALDLKQAFEQQQPLLAVTAAGCLPYWSELPSLDMLGLNDYYLPRNPPKDFGNGYLGHELGEGRYVLDRNPDIITFNVGSLPSFRSGAELQQMPEFHQRYRPIPVKVTNNNVALIYFNQYSNKIGIQRMAESIVIPGFLFSGRGSTAHLNKEGRLVTQLTSAQALQFTFTHPEKKAWQIEVKSPDSNKVQTAYRQQGKSLSIALISNSSSPIEIEEVVLR